MLSVPSAWHTLPLSMSLKVPAAAPAHSPSLTAPVSLPFMDVTTGRGAFMNSLPVYGLALVGCWLEGHKDLVCFVHSQVLLQYLTHETPQQLLNE